MANLALRVLRRIGIEISTGPAVVVPLPPRSALRARLEADRAGRAPSPASPLDGIVGSRPLIDAGLDPLDVDRDGKVQRDRYGSKDPQEVLDNIALYNPDASQHINNLLRMCLPGNLEITAYRIVGGKRTQQIDEEASEDLREWGLTPDRIGRVYGGGLQSIGLVQLRTLITAGAIAAEIQPSKTLDDILDVCPVTPGCIDMISRGGNVVWRYKPKTGEPIDLNPNQFIYIPLDPQHTAR